MDRNITDNSNRHSELTVALRKESVDRNSVGKCLAYCNVMSLSARRAWIEIDTTEVEAATGLCRSPQGERG